MSWTPGSWALIQELHKLWGAHPHQRLGQLIYNLAGEELFYMSDDRLLEAIRRAWIEWAIYVDPRK